MHLCGHFSCGTAWSPLHEVPLQLLCPTQAALQRLWSHFSTQVKTIQEKERGGWMEGPAQPGRTVLGALGWSSLSKGTFSQVLLQKFVFLPGAMCAVCVLSSGPAPALLLECSHGRERGPSFSRGTSVCAGLCWLMARVRCCWQKKGGCQSAPEKTAASGKA